MHAVTSMTPPIALVPGTALEKDMFAGIPETPSHKDASLHRVLIIGGGAAGLELATRLGQKFGKRRRASITLVDRNRTHIWKPLLHEVASGSLNATSDLVEYIAHAHRHHYRYRIGEVVGIDRVKRQVFVAPSFDEDGKQIIPPRVLGYDTLVMAVGSVCNDFGTPGAAMNAIALDSADPGRPLQPPHDRCVPSRQCAIRAAVAGSAPLRHHRRRGDRRRARGRAAQVDAGNRVAQPRQHRFRETDPDHRHRGGTTHPPGFAGAPVALLRHSGLSILGFRYDAACEVTEVTPDGVKLGEKLFLPAELVVWSAGIKAPDFLKNLDGLETDRINRLVVDETLQA